MDLFTYLLGKKGQNTQRDLFSYLLGKGAGGSGTYVNFTGTSLNISNTLKARIKNITLKGATSQDGTPTPDYPQPIKVVTGDNSIVIPRNNLFNPLQTYPTGSLSQNCNIELTNLAQGQTYYFYANEKAYLYVKIYNANGTLSRTVGSDTSSSKKVNFTLTSNETKIIGTFYATTNYDVSTYDWTNVYISTIDSYEPYNPQTYPLSLGTLELAKIRTYQDYIYGTPNNWYKKGYVRHLSLAITDMNNSEGYPGWRSSQFRTDLGVNRNGQLNSFTTYMSNITLFNANGISVNTGEVSSSYSALWLSKTTFGLTQTQWKTNYSDLVFELFYGLSAPYDEPITDTTLIEQLNNLYNATSQEGTTIITCSSSSDDNETIVFSGDIKVTSVGNSLNISLLSNEEPNLDEIEDIEQNDEPIEEEVS